MHESLARLLEYARTKTAGALHPVCDEADLRMRMGVSPAVMSNWKTRGVSKEGALAAEAKFGCSAHWVLTGKAEAAAIKAWPFALLTPDQLRELPPEHLETVQKVALDLLKLSKRAVPPRVSHVDTELSNKNNIIEGSIPKPDFMEQERSGQRHPAERPSRKTRGG